MFSRSIDKKSLGYFVPRDSFLLKFDKVALSILNRNIDKTAVIEFCIIVFELSIIAFSLLSTLLLIPFYAFIANIVVLILDFFIVDSIKIGYEKTIFTKCHKRIYIFDIFYYFKSFKLFLKQLLFRLVVGIARFITTVICFTPSAILFFILFNYGNSVTSFTQVSLFVFSVVLLVLGVFYFLIVISKIYIFRYVLISKEKYNIFKILKCCFIYSEEIQSRVIMQHIAFIPLLIMLIVPFTWFFIQPYFKIKKMLLAKKILSSNM